MNRLEKALSVGTLVLAFASCCKGPSCNKDSEQSDDAWIPATYLEGTVKKETGSVAQIVESSGALFGNESIKFGNPNYILTVETDQGEYVIEVYENAEEYRYETGSNSKKSLLALAEAIKVGDRIRFKTTSGERKRFGKGILYRGENEDFFSKDKIGKIRVDYIETLGK